MMGSQSLMATPEGLCTTQLTSLSNFSNSATEIFQVPIYFQAYLSYDSLMVDCLN